MTSLLWAFALCSLLCALTGVAGAPPPNDDCNNAIAITASSTSGTTVEATRSTIGCASYSYPAVFYTYTTIYANSNINFSVGSNYVGFQKGTCSSATCVTSSWNGGTVYNRQSTTTTYIVSVHAGSPSGAPFTLTITETEVTPIPGESCEGAITLSAGVPYSGTISGNANLPDPCPNGNNVQAAYFTYTTTSNNTIVKMSNCDAPSSVITLLDGADCSSITSCAQSASGACLNGPGTYYRTDPLPMGSVVLFRMTGGSYTVVVEEESPPAEIPPANAMCANATVLPYYTIYNGSTLGTAVDNAAWYWTPFDATAEPVYLEYNVTYETSLVTVSTCGWETDFHTVLNYKTDCARDTVAFRNSGCLSNNAATLSFLAAAGPVYIGVSGYNDAEGYYSVIASEREVATVPNSRCENALPLSHNTPVTVNFYGALLRPSMCTGPDRSLVWFTYLSEMGSSTVEVRVVTNIRQSTSTSLSIARQTDPVCSEFEFTCLASVSDNPDSVYAAVANTAAGVPYVISFGATALNPDSTVTITAKETFYPNPTNLDCSTAINLTKGVSVTGFLFKAVNKYACTGLGVADVPALFYKYTVQQNNVLLDFKKSYTNGGDTRFLQIVWSSASCTVSNGKQTFGSCKRQDGVTPMGPVSAGAQLYIIVSGPLGAAQGSEFTLIVDEIPGAIAPTNVNCGSAYGMTSGVVFNTTTFLAPATQVSSSTVYTFYKYTSTMPNSYITIEAQRIDSAAAYLRNFYYLGTSCPGSINGSTTVYVSSGCSFYMVLNSASGSQYYFGLGPYTSTSSPSNDSVDLFRMKLMEKPQGSTASNSACNVAQSIPPGVQVTGSTMGMPLVALPGTSSPQFRAAYYVYTTTMDFSLLTIDSCMGRPCQQQYLLLYASCSTPSPLRSASGSGCFLITYPTSAPANTMFYIVVYSNPSPTEFALQVTEEEWPQYNNYACENRTILTNYVTISDTPATPILPSQSICLTSGNHFKYYGYTTGGGTSLQIDFNAGISGRNGIFSNTVAVLAGGCLIPACLDLIAPPPGPSGDNHYRFQVADTLPSGTELVIVVSWDYGVYQISVEEVVPTPSSTRTPSSSPSMSSSASRSPSPSSTSSDSRTPSSSPSSSSSMTPTPSSSPTSSASQTGTPSSSMTTSDSSTSSPSASVSPSSSPSQTGSDSSSRTPTPSVTPTGTSTSSDSPSASSSITPTPSSSMTTTPSSSVTPTPTSTSSDSPSASSSLTPTPSSSQTPTPSSSVTPTPTSTSSDSPSASPSMTSSPSSSQTTTPSSSVTGTSTSSDSPSITSTPSSSQTNTPSSSVTPTSSDSPSASSSVTPTSSSSQTSTPSSSITSTPSSSLTTTPSSSVTPTSTSTSSDSPSASASSSQTSSSSSSVTPTGTPTSSDSASASSSITPSPSSSPSSTPSSTATPTGTSTSSDSPSASSSITLTPSSSITLTGTSTSSDSPSASLSVSPTPTSSVTPTGTVSDSSTPSVSPSVSSSSSSSSSETASGTPTPTSSVSLSAAASVSPTGSDSSSASQSASASFSLGASPSASSSASLSLGSSISSTPTGSNSPSSSSSETASLSVGASTTPSSSFTASATTSVTSSLSFNESPSSSPSILPSPSASTSISMSATGTILRLPGTTATATPRDPINMAPPVAAASVAFNPSASSSPGVAVSTGAASSGGTGGTNTTTNTALTVTKDNPVRVALNNDGSTNTLAIADESGAKTVSVNIPANVIAGLPPGSLINAQFVDVTSATAAISGSGFSLGSTIIDLTLTDSGGAPLNFAGDIELCFQVAAVDANVNGACLGFLNEDTGEWECQDELLQENGSGEFCGSTPHFTSFALLLGASCGPDCSSGQEQLIQWLSLGFACGGVAMVLVGVMLVEVRIRNQRRRMTNQLRRTKALTDSMSMSRSK